MMVSSSRHNTGKHLTLGSGLVLTSKIGTRGKTLKRGKKDMKDDRLWKWFSLYIRLRDADNKGIITCITCGAKHFWKGTNQVNAGHFMSRKHNATKYDEMNVHGQCVACNKYGYGKGFE